MPEIDRTTYNKAKKYAPGHGYEQRMAAPSSIIVHSTSNPNQKNTPFESEAKFLLDAPLVGAHYLIGKDGRIVEFLDPRRYAAWHAGNAQKAYLNERSIGIELHHSVGDAPYPSKQLEALGELIVALCAEFNIPFGLVDTHGQVAIKGPYIRKSDPSDWSHKDFLSFRSHLQAAPTPPVSLPNKFKIKGTPVWQRQDCTGPVALYLNPGTVIECDAFYPEGTAHLATGAGFIRLDASVEAV